MKLLLDENLPHRLRHELVGHDCFTAKYMDWCGIKNGDLLALAASHGFDAVLTKDTKIEYEQNLENLPLAVVVLDADSNDMELITPLLPELLESLGSLPPKQVTHVPRP